jgi:hypothetical protein
MLLNCARAVPLFSIAATSHTPIAPSGSASLRARDPRSRLWLRTLQPH